MELILAPWNDHEEHDQSIRETGRVFNEALQIIKNQFPLHLGDLKIVDEKYGYVILKENILCFRGLLQRFVQNSKFRLNVTIFHDLMTTCSPATSTHFYV